MIKAFNQLPGNVRGTLFALVAAALFTVVSAIVKYAARDYHIAQILLFRQVVMFAIISPVVWRHFPYSLRTKRPVLHIIRLFGALTALSLSFVAVAHLPLATAISLSFTKTMFVTVLAIPMLGEVVGWRRFLAIAVGFVGMLIMLRPDPGSAISIYALFAVIAAGGAALAVASVRKLSNTETAETMLSFQAIFVGLIVAIPAIYFWKTPDLSGLVALVAIGAVSAAAQWMGVSAYKAGEVSVVTGMEYTKLIYATIIGIVVFSEWPDVKSLIGAFIIVAASAFTIWRENRARTRP